LKIVVPEVSSKLALTTVSSAAPAPAAVRASQPSHVAAERGHPRTKLPCGGVIPVAPEM
jgi:hypothetical protein